MIGVSCDNTTVRDGMRKMLGLTAGLLSASKKQSVQPFPYDKSASPSMVRTNLDCKQSPQDRPVLACSVAPGAQAGAG